MGNRFIGLWTDDPTSLAHDRLRSFASARADLVPGLAQANITLLYQRDACVTRTSDGAGLLVGSAFRRCSETFASRVLSTIPVRLEHMSATSLMDMVWGNYIAVLPGRRGQVEILRAPLGALPCYYVIIEDAVAFASDVTLLVESGLYAPRVDWDEVALDLLVLDQRRPATCLSGLHELPGGQRLVLERGLARREEIWTPWSFVTSNQAILDPALAATAVREAVIDATAAHAAVHNNPVLKLSGGLDSSIVAVSLAASGHRFTPVTMTTHAPSGDERIYARAVARSCGAPLIEAIRSIAGVDIGTSASARLPRPGARSFAQETARIMSGVAMETGATAIFEGGGGDNVFCNIHSAVAVADALRSYGAGVVAWRAAQDTATITGAGVPSIVRRAAQRAWFSDRGYRWPTDDGFLSPAALRRLDDLMHPWLIPPPGTLPGRGTHVALVTAAQSWIEGQDPEDPFPIIAPLLSQPVVETCLRVPTWMWIAGGINRAVARQAFADRLPPEIATRRTKGTPESFLAELFEANRQRIATLLQDGMLMERGLLDVTQLASMLRDRAPLRGRNFLRVLRLVDVETWARAQAG